MTSAIRRTLPAIAAAIQDEKDPLLPLHPESRALVASKQLRRLAQLLGKEVHLLDRIRYKQKNQHKSATWWRHVAGAFKAARLVHNELDALFMPLAMTLKTILARFHTLSTLLEQEVGGALTLLRDSAARSPNASLLDDLQARITKLPRQMSRFYTQARARKRERDRVPAEQAQSGLGTTKPTRTGTPLSSTAGTPHLKLPHTDVAEDDPSSLYWKVQQEETPPSSRPRSLDSQEVVSDVTQIEYGSNRIQQEPTISKEELPPPAPRLRKKRKPIKPKDDIDDIFGQM
ncbi:hypothetical protein EMMF5_002591 [Cystobasidiomycetes sp. EMM_F5]